MDNFNIKDSIEELQNKFNEIKKMGYVKGISQNNKGNAGLTFEKLIGKYNDNKFFPHIIQKYNFNWIALYIAL